LDSSNAGNVEVTTRLIELGFDVNCRGDARMTPLHLATQWSHLAVVTVLLKSGATPNARDVGEETPLFRARSVEVADALIRAGADVNAVDDNGDSCLAVHFAEGRSDIVRLLVESGAALKYGPRGVVGDRQIDGEKAILEFFESTGNTKGREEWMISKSVDYGSVLPVKSLAKSDLYETKPEEGK